MITIEPYLRSFHGQERIFLRADYTPAVSDALKKIPGIKWDHGSRDWHARMNVKVINLIISFTFGLASVDLEKLNSQIRQQTEEEEKKTISKLAPETRFQVSSFRKWMEQKRYSRATIENYLEQLIRYLSFHAPRSHRQLVV